MLGIRLATCFLLNDYDQPSPLLLDGACIKPGKGKKHCFMRRGEAMVPQSLFSREKCSKQLRVVFTLVIFFLKLGWSLSWSGLEARSNTSTRSGNNTTLALDS